MNIFEEAKYINKLNSRQHRLKEAAGFPKYYLALNHFEPDDLLTIKIRNEKELHNLESLEDWFIEDITDEHGFYLVDHNDEDINFVKLPASSKEALRKLMVNELKQHLKTNGEEMREYQEDSLDTLGMDIFFYDLDLSDDDEEAAAQIADNWFEWVDNTYVDGDSNSEYEFANMDDWKKDAWSYSELFEESYKRNNNNKRLTESVIFHEVDSDEVEDASDWAILDNDKWFANGDGLLLEKNRTHRELIFSKNHENAIHRALEDFEGEELLQELKRITGLEYVEDEFSDYSGGWQKIYYPKGAFTREEIDWFSDAYFGNYTVYATVDDNVDPQYIWVFDSDKRKPEEIIAADTGLPVSEVVIKKIKGYKQVPIYED